MNCYKHENKQAVSICEKCNRLICEECEIQLGNKPYCNDCINIAFKNSTSNNNISEDIPDNYIHSQNPKTNNSKNIRVENPKYPNIEKHINLKDNYKNINIILAIISIIFLFIKGYNIYSFMIEDCEAYHVGFIEATFQVVYVLLSIIMIVIFLILTLLLVKNIIYIDYKTRLISPLLISLVFGIFVSSLQLTNYNYNFNLIQCIIDLIHATLITLGTYISKDSDKLNSNNLNYSKHIISVLSILSIVFALPLLKIIIYNFVNIISKTIYIFDIISEYGTEELLYYFCDILDLFFSIIGIIPIFILSIILIKRFVIIDYRKRILASIFLLVISPISSYSSYCLFDGDFFFFELSQIMMFVPSIAFIIIGTYLEHIYITNEKDILSSSNDINNV